MKYHVWRVGPDGEREPVGVYRGEDVDAHVADLPNSDELVAEPVITDEAGLGE